ncbi:tRNA (adenine(22)-N(1))-methyltransferase TrmK [Bacillus sp. EB600]|uniref:tRNA (adenine(22)-N(1))-methyltransferase n=1 Tax=Bacillus sp. EB600 TaxID=2806345 RepID=UPI00210A99F2|nr:tRNA (adenine(22)-N(1))-methyltransferase TrmK [Bacillus sp. EB600]MCQ6278130.1 tRNA (adenine-N(1))-methyltransferase [Bacillus sp. EB600]
MNTEKLSARLETVAHFVPLGSKLADIGSDHAYLPCYLAKKGVITFAVAGEVVSGPFESARRHVEAENLTEMISVRMGDGLDILEPRDVDCITIAGMGGALITSILERGKEKLGTINRLILQPNISAVTIRKWLLVNNWELIAEEIVEEEGKIYEILVAEQGNPLKPYGPELDTELLVGPFLLKKKGNAFVKKWRIEVENWHKILAQLEKASASEETIQKRQELLQMINWVEEEIK